MRLREVSGLDGLNEVIASALAETPVVSFFGLFFIPISIIISWAVMAVLVTSSILLTRNLKKIPTKSQALLEMAIGFFNNFCKEHLGKHWRVFAPWLGTIALYIVGCNLTGLFGAPPPTQSFSIPATLAIMSAVLIYGAQFRYRGVRGGLKKFASPVPFLFPLNVMEVVIRPLSLCMRLFGNVLATHIVMEILKSLAPAVLPVPFSLYFDLFDGIIQTLIFVVLTTLFLSESIQDHE